MRILAIRGSNITSLAGSFEVRLDEGPLAGVGLFSITGPTGSGKSSLLDALCLALFANAPRLEGQTKVGTSDEPEQERLTTKDARTLLRRNTAGGHAEVDFVGVDDRRYRARWEVRRARGSSKGKLQNASVSLLDVEREQRLGGTNTETLAAIVRALGLDYEQFCRSALLAQGAFDAFLSAKADERSALLEQMTGTQIYRQISKAAFERDKDESAKLKLLSDAIRLVPTLEATAREALDLSLGTLAELRERRAGEVALLEAAARWFVDEARHLDHEGEAREELARARQAGLDAEALRAEYAGVERALPLRSLLQAEREALARCEVAEAGGVGARAEADASEAARSLAADAHAASGGLRAEAATRREAARPELERASKLDALIEAKSARVEAMRARADAAVRERDEVAGKLGATEASLGDFARRLDEGKAWLAARGAVAAVEPQWERWASELARYDEAARLLGGLRAKHRALAAEAESARVALDPLAADAEALKGASAAAHRAWLGASESAQAAQLSEAHRAERSTAVEAVSALEALADLGPRIEQTTTALERERARERAAREQHEEARGLHLAAEAGLPSARALAEEARRAADRMQAALQLEDHRARLVEGEPCPLCGAEAHPYALGRGPVVALFDAQRERVLELEADLQALERRRVEAEARAGAASAARGEAEARGGELADQLGQLRERWRGLLGRAGIAEVVADEAALAQVGSRLAALRARLAELRDAEEGAAASAIEADRLQRAWQGAEAEAQRAAKDAEGGRARLALALEAVEKSRAEGQFARQDSERVLDLLAPVFVADDGWRARVERDARAFTAAHADEVRAYRAARESLAATASALAQLGSEREGLLGILAVRERAAAELLGALIEEERTLDVDRAARAALLGGASTAEALARLDRALTEAASAHERTGDELRAAEALLVQARQRVAAAAAAAEEAASALARARDRLTEALAALGTERPAVEALLARDAAWAERTRADLARLDEAQRTAAAVLAERERVRVAHRSDPARPTIAEPECAERLAAAREDLTRASDALATAQAERRRDDEARAQLGARGAELARATKEAERWRTLRELIGASDGKKFATFAQSLTLDALLHSANQQLRELNPRYRLMRVPGSEMDLQVVDHDMGDEVRGVNSLSGGEKFLVSLALALGLSTIAARNVRIDTLFIDEGFGTLDPETLDLALAALEALQATGKQVGVISHVRALADKIGTQVRVERQGVGRSRVIVEG